MMKSPSKHGGVSGNSWFREIANAIPAGGMIVPVGSRVTCSPPPMDTDEDFLVLVKDKASAVEALKEFGFEAPSTPEQIKEYDGLNENSMYQFSSLRLGDVNYIVTESPFFFERFLTATYVCKELNLLKKEDRIMVFEAVRGASFAHHVEPKMKRDLEGDADKARRYISHGMEMEAHLANNVQVNISDVPF